MRKLSPAIDSLDSILELGDRIYDVLAIISLSAGINILTGISFESKTALLSIKFWSICVSGIFMLFSGVSFSWLSYWHKRYVQYSLVDAAQKIINEGKEKKFIRHSVKAWSLFLLAIMVYLIGRIYG